MEQTIRGVLRVGSEGTGSSVGYQLKGDGGELARMGGSDIVLYSLDNGTTWVDCYLYHNDIWLFNVTKIIFKVRTRGYQWGGITSTKLGLNMDAEYGEQIVECELTEDITDIVLSVTIGGGAGA